MKHLSEKQLVLHYYGEDDTAVVQEHLEACSGCRAEFERLQQMLRLVSAPAVPERAEDYGTLVWQRIRPILPERAAAWWHAWLRPQRLAWTGAVAVLLVVAFLAGRMWQKPQPPVAQSRPENVRERVLLVAVGSHLERSQLVLLELMNADPKGTLDIAAEQELASDLVSANRLYRQAAQKSSEPAVRTVLDQLEQVLIEIANSPSELDSARLAEIQDRIRSQGLLFRIRVLGSKVKGKRVPQTPDLGTT